MTEIYALDGVAPEIAATAWVAPGAKLIGRIALRDEANVWFNAVLRGDNELIEIGPRSNVQDGCVLHTDPGCPLTIGAECTIGHNVILHGCTIEEGALIGMGATILNRARIAKGCLVGANALVTEGKEFPENSLIVGSPAKAVRELTPDALNGIRLSAAGYVARAKRFRDGIAAV